VCGLGFGETGRVLHCPLAAKGKVAIDFLACRDELEALLETLVCIIKTRLFHGIQSTSLLLAETAEDRLDVANLRQSSLVTRYQRKYVFPLL